MWEGKWCMGGWSNRVIARDRRSSIRFVSGVDQAMPVSLKRLKFIAAEWCNPTSTVKSWECLTEAERSRILEFISLKPGEVPLVAVPDGPSPLMLSSYRLVWLSGGRTTELDLNRISAVNPPQDSNYDKLKLHTLVIETNDSRTHFLEVPPGRDCFSVWNLLLRFMGNGFAGR